MSKNKNKQLEEMYIINLNNKEINKTTKENEKNINILEYCKKFCKEYGDKDFSTYNIFNLKNIYNEGKGLLDTYFIAEEKEQTDTKYIIQLEYIIMNANYILNIKQMENTRQKTVELSEKLNKTMHRAKKLESDAESRTKEIERVKDDMKGIITTILAIVLAFSIIPTAIEGINKIDANYILPFIMSIVVFGMFMVVFIYSIYQDNLKTSTYTIFTISIMITILLWINSIFNFIDIGNNKNKEGNKVENNVAQESIKEN